MPAISTTSDSGADVDDARAEDLGQLHDRRRGSRASARDLDQRQIADDRRAIGDVLDAHARESACRGAPGSAARRRRRSATTTVMRETPGVSLWPTVSDSMLKPRRRNSDATRFSTPGRSST